MEYDRPSQNYYPGQAGESVDEVDADLWRQAASAPEALQSEYYGLLFNVTTARLHAERTQDEDDIAWLVEAKQAQIDFEGEHRLVPEPPDRAREDET